MLSLAAGRVWAFGLFGHFGLVYLVPENFGF
jgi:hypothetical protein